MAYSNNPKLPRVRMEAVRLVEQGWSLRQVARHFGYHHTAVMRWMQKAPLYRGKQTLPTLSSRPHHHPHELKKEIVSKILEYRSRRNQCAFIVHHLLETDGYKVSLASVRRVLKRRGISRYSKWKKWHQYTEKTRRKNVCIHPA